jgi:hypothetical protein
VRVEESHLQDEMRCTMCEGKKQSGIIYARARPWGAVAVINAVRSCEHDASRERHLFPRHLRLCLCLWLYISADTRHTYNQKINVPGRK